MTAFEEGLGRVTYVVGALEYKRPCLAPLYKFLPEAQVRRVPAYVSFLPSYLSGATTLNKHFSCAIELRPSAGSPRFDAQASATRS